MWSLILEFQTYRGDSVQYYWPLFNTASECLWWLDHIWTMLEQNGAHDATKAVCEFRPKASLK